MGPADLKSRTNPRIVLVDNDEFILEALSELFRAKGYEIQVARDGLEALNIIKQHRPSCIILDVIMPRLDGSQLCRLIRQDPTVRNTSIIAFSSLAATDFQKFPGLSADAYVAKGPLPIAFENLLRAITSLREPAEKDSAKKGFGYDVVHPRQVQTELLWQYWHYGNVLQALGDGVLELDRDGRILSATAGALDLLGQRATSLIGNALASAFPAVDERPIRDLLAAMARAEEPQRWRSALHSGDKELMVRICPIFEEGACTGFIVLMDLL